MLNYRSLLFIVFLTCSPHLLVFGQTNNREIINLNSGWKFMKYSSQPDSLFYDERPEIKSHNDNIVADTKAAIESKTKTNKNALKPWILPTANAFINDPQKHYQYPSENPKSTFDFTKNNFDDSNWESVTLPHDWAINGPFYVGYPAEVGGGMGRLPSPGVAWYRNTFTVNAADQSKRIYLNIDGAMSYSMVWLNGKLVGGWPYGYNSYRLDLTPFLNFKGKNQLAIRLDNPNYSSRWYTGGGLYRKVWLEKTNTVAVAQWGTFITTKNSSEKSAEIEAIVKISNENKKTQNVQIKGEIIDLQTNKIASEFPSMDLLAKSGLNEVKSTFVLQQPQLWGPYPSQKPNLYKVVFKVYIKNKQVDQYETNFGIRDLKFDGQKGLFVNGKPIRIQGVNQHHDLGASGAAFNVRAAERQLEILREMGVNAIRLAHNPPAPELLHLTDKMGFLVINESFDSWAKGKTPYDYNLLFKDWAEADMRSFIRRDRNHPSIIAWSYGNEVGEQYTDVEGAKIAKMLADIVKEEDPTRPTTASMNYAKPNMPFPEVMDVISLNYQGEGIRDAPAYAHLNGIRTTPLYPAFHEKFPNKMIISSETASTLSSRGSYFFPLTNDFSAPVEKDKGGNEKLEEVSDYGLYTAQFGASPDKVFKTQDEHPYVSGEFVWSGFDYLGEPTPYYTARSSYSGIVDLAGFKKDRFYQYQSRWRPDFPMVHILPHWNWPERIGQVTPVHVFTSGDEVELFLNGKLLGKKKKAALEYRLRWDDLKYEPGELKAVSYKNGKKWAEETIATTGKPASLQLEADRSIINADGEDLSFITVLLKDENGFTVPNATNTITFSVEGAGEIVATDNGDPAELNSFSSHERSAFAGMALVIVKGNKNQKGNIKITAKSEGLKSAEMVINSK